MSSCTLGSRDCARWKCINILLYMREHYIMDLRLASLLIWTLTLCVFPYITYCMPTSVARTCIHVECERQTNCPDTCIIALINVTLTVQKIIASCLYVGLWLKVTFFSSMPVTFDYISWTSWRKYMGIDELDWLGN